MSMTQDEIETLVKKRREELEAQDNATLLCNRREERIEALVEDYEETYEEEIKALVAVYKESLVEAYEEELAGQTDVELFGDGLDAQREQAIESLVEEYRESLEEDEGQ